jgi:NAD(P)H-dependent flavin oxidoreductase YrpB (nitropropane dioxygenase family)
MIITITGTTFSIHIVILLHYKGIGDNLRLRTELCKTLNIQYPVMLAGMGPVAGGSVGPVATAELAAAVSNAGGLGVLGGTGYSPDRLREEIRKVRSLTSKPFGVDLLLPSNYMSGAEKKTKNLKELVPDELKNGLKEILENLGVPWVEAPVEPTTQREPGSGRSDGQMEVVIEEKIPVFASGLGSPAQWMDRLHANGIFVLSLVGNVRNARHVANSGVDAIVAQGTEAGGHTGHIGTLALLTQVIDAVSPLPVVAAGGIASGRGLAAILASGAQAAWCGTAFLVAEEANQPIEQQNRVIAAEAEDTRITRLYSGKTMRNINNSLIEAFEKSGLPTLPMGIQDIAIRDVVYSLRQSGREDLLMNAAGQIAGSLNEVRPAGVIVEEIIRETIIILTSTLPEMVEAGLD